MSNLFQDEYYLNYLSNQDIDTVNERLKKFFEENDIKDVPIFISLEGHVARRIKYVSRKASCRRVAEICFPEDDNRHGVQMDGRDIKRWAAIQMNDLFTKVEDHGEYWHEY